MTKSSLRTLTPNPSQTGIWTPFAFRLFSIFPFSKAPSNRPSSSILALRDIVAPRYRRALTSTLISILSVIKTGAWWGGKGLYVLMSGAIMLTVPFAVCMAEEKQFME